MKTLFVLFIALLIPCASLAESQSKKIARSVLIPDQNANCQLIETANININFNSIEKNLDIASSLIEKKMTEIKSIANEAGAEKVDITAISYNLSPFNGPSTDGIWQVNGSLSLTIVPASKGKDILVLLTSHKFQTNLNVNAYRNGVCQ